MTLYNFEKVKANLQIQIWISQVLFIILDEIEDLRKVWKG